MEYYKKVDKSLFRYGAIIPKSILILLCMENGLNRKNVASDFTVEREKDKISSFRQFINGKAINRFILAFVGIIIMNCLLL